MRALILLAALSLVYVFPAPAQVIDSFDDGDFSRDPAWAGSTYGWTVDTLLGSPALRTDGLAARDTLHLATPSPVSYGRWAFTFGYAGVNLSTFNGVRVFLVADSADLEGSVRGYFLQFGTNNSDEVRLYRQDGDPATARAELGRSTPLLTSESAVVRVVVVRTGDDRWSVEVDGAVVLTAEDGRYAESRAFGFWVKHTDEARRAYAFDDIDVQGTPSRPDDEPPRVTSVAYDPAAAALHVAFSESVNPATLRPETFDVIGHGPPAAVEYDGAAPAAVRLVFPAPLPPGAFYLAITGVTDLAGNPVAPDTQIPFEVPGEAVPPPAPGEVVVNEILYDPPEDVPEFVELYNRSDRDVDLAGLALSDDRLQAVPLANARVLLPVGGYAVLTADSAAFGRAFPGVACLPLRPWPALNNGGDAVVLTAGEVVVDAVAYLPGWGGDGVSLERVDPAGPSAHRRNFAPSTAPGGATPGTVNSRYAPDRTAPRLRFAEQIDGRTVEVVFSEPVDPGSLAADAFVLDGLAGAFEARTDTSGLVRFDGDVAGGTLRVAGLRDLTGNVRASDERPVATPAGPGDLVVNEILFAPRADPYDGLPDQPEYVELLNPTGRLVSLRGAFWTDRPDERGAADTLFLPAGLHALPPGGYALVYARTGGDLIGAFPGLAGDTTILFLPVPRASLGLPNAGDVVRLHRRDGLIVEAARYDPDWHEPALTDATGAALERIDPAAPAGERTSWATSRSASGGTPGRPNTVRRLPDHASPGPGTLILNEILYEPAAGSGGIEQPEFVELFNRSSTPIDLNGAYWTIRAGSSDPADTLRFAASPAALPPGGYAVVFAVPATATEMPSERLRAAFPGAGQEALLLPVRGASLGLVNAGGLVRLHGADGAVLDEAAYGPDLHHAALVRTAGVSLERADPAGTAWSSSVDPEGATPGRANSLGAAAAGPATTPGVDVSPSPFSVERDGVAVVRYRVGAATSLVRARVFDSHGRLVRTLAGAHLSGAEGQLLWDGLDDAGRRLRTGIYVVFLEALDAGGGAAEAYKAPVVLARPFD